MDTLVALVDERIKELLSQVDYKNETKVMLDTRYDHMNMLLIDLWL